MCRDIRKQFHPLLSLWPELRNGTSHSLKEQPLVPCPNIQEVFFFSDSRETLLMRQLKIAQDGRLPWSLGPLSPLARSSAQPSPSALCFLLSAPAFEDAVLPLLLK